MSYCKSLGVAAIVSVMIISLTLCAMPVLMHSEWIRIYRQIESSINHLQPTNPKAIDPKQWECARGAIKTALCNLTPGNTSNAEMAQLRDDLESKLTEEIDLDTMWWIWERIGGTGPFGKQYIERFQFMQHCIPRARPALAAEPDAANR
jgi:hypothetical protein